MRILTVPTLALAALTMSVAFGAPGAGVSAQNVGEKFTAFAINLNSGPKTATLDISIDRWSTDAEREQLLSILLEEKDQYRANQALLKALQKSRRWLHSDAAKLPGRPLSSAEPDGDAEHDRRRTDRPSVFLESEPPRSMDYRSRSLYMP